MGSIADLSDLTSRASDPANGRGLWFHKVARIAGAAPPATIAGRWHSLWTYDGQPGAGVAPGAVSVPTAATAGALPFVNAPGGSEVKLIQAWATGLVGGTLLLYDRLLHIGGLSGTNTAAQAVGGTITRNADGAMAWAEIYALIGTTATTVQINYVDQGGAASTGPATSIGGTGFREQTRAILLPLASGDTSIQSVTNIDLLASTGTVGNIGVTVGRPLAYCGIGGIGLPGWRDFVTGLPGIPTLDPDSCLALLWSPATVTAPEIFGGYSCLDVVA